MKFQLHKFSKNIIRNPNFINNIPDKRKNKKSISFQTFNIQHIS